MAAQAAPALPGLASGALDVLPSLSSILPQRSSRGSILSLFSPRKPASSQQFSTAAQPSEDRANTPSNHTQRVPSCEALRGVSLDSLRPTFSVQALSAGFSVQSLISSAGPSMARLRPFALPPASAPAHFRPFSSKAFFRTFHSRPFARSIVLPPSQARSLSTVGNFNYSRLSHLEQTANNNPSSASAQSSFYTALLRANMPDILIERYETGRYANNPAIDAMYFRGLERVSQAGNSSVNYPGNAQQPMQQEQTNEIARAAVASMRGASGTTQAQFSSTHSGDRRNPVHVVVNDSWKTYAWKAIRYSISLLLISYVFLMVGSTLLEAAGIGKAGKAGGPQNSEVKPEQQKARFSDVKGCDEAIEEFKEVVDFLKSPEKYNKLGGKLPKGVLMIGPPGTGKTLLARAVAGEAGVPFFYMSGSEFDEVYVGVGAKRVRELFANAKAKAPAIVFIDELDAVGGKRNERDAAYHMQTLNQMLTELDGFDQTSGIVFIAATNFPQMLDKALTRPGRFDRQVYIGLPDVRGRVDILRHYLRNMQAGKDVDSTVLARGTPGFSGADLENLINQAAVHASKLGEKRIGMLDLEWAKDRVLMGAEKKSMVLTDDEKLKTAYHEAGHALVSLYTPGSTPLYKCTIMPRGSALGITFSLPEMDKHSSTKEELMAYIDMAMGGKLAEELIYGSQKVTSGCSSDLSESTNTAYQMVMNFGMSDTLGSIAFDNKLYQVLSTQTKQQIESEVRRLLSEGEQRARELLANKREELELLAKALIEYETLNRDEIDKVVKGEKLTNRVGVPQNTPLKLPEISLPAGAANANQDESSGPPPNITEPAGS